MTSMMKTVFAGSLLLGALAFAGAPARKAAPADELMNNYLAIHTALAADKTDGVVDAAKRLEQAAASLAKKDKSLAALKDQAKALSGAKDLKTARDAFKPVSATVAAWVQSGAKTAKPVGVFHCPMANASWVQEGDGVLNPYYGSEMLTCGEKVTK